MEAFPERMRFPGRLASIEFLILDAVYRGGGLWDWNCIGGFDDLSFAVSQSCQCRKTTTGLSQRAGRSFLPKSFINNLILKRYQGWITAAVGTFLNEKPGPLKTGGQGGSRGGMDVSY